MLSRFSIFLIDHLMILFSCISIYLVRYGFSGLTPEVRADGITLTLLLILFNTIFFVSFRTFSGILRFSSFTDLMRIFYALVMGYLLTFIAVQVIKRFDPEFAASNVTFIAIFFLNMFLMIFSRILVKETYESITGRGVKPVNIFIYGTKQAGISVAKALKGNNEFNYRVLGFISDEHHMIGKQLMGVTIHANDENLFRTLETKDVKTIIVSLQKMQEIKNSNLLVNFVDHNIALLTTVPVNEWSGTMMSKAQIKDVQIEDLLPRDPIQVNMLQIAENLEGKR
ncbi:MAG TPA: polysaccharide biosynthesis protein, partial [Proteiniphilum sp.]|nr:polysaccharide biosynthesis protein [Proteiniphilum sp.]